MLSFISSRTATSATPTSSGYYETINSLCLQDALHQTMATRNRREVASTDSSPLCAIPVEIQLHIFSYLDASSLCSLSKTCSCLGHTSSDPLLWLALLLKDSMNWSVIGHLSHPRVYQDASSDLHPKRVYGQCYLNRGSVQKSSFTNFVTGRIKWFIGRLHGHVPKVLVFGSGMESLPSSVCFYGRSPLPLNQLDCTQERKVGVGSGVCIEHSDGSPVNLVTLYTSIRAERDKVQHDTPQRINRLTRSCDHSEAVELTRSVSDLCRQADAYMLIVDADTGPSDDVDKLLLKSMLQSGPAQTPLLVVAATSCSNGVPNKLQPLDIADMLELCKLPHHPWQVRQTTLGAFSGLQDGLHWLLHKS